MGFWDIFGTGSKAKSENSQQARQPTALTSPFTYVEGRVIAAFSKVKQDITLLSSWVRYLKHKDFQNDQRHTKTQRELGEHKAIISGLKTETAELKLAIRDLRGELKMAAQVRERNLFTEKGSSKNDETGPLTDQIRTKSEPSPDLKRTHFENRVVSMLRSRRKDYVLKNIMQLAATETHSTKEIEEIIVGEKALCGRTAFYDYLKELKHRKMVKQAERGTKRVILPQDAD